MVDLAIEISMMVVGDWYLGSRFWSFKEVLAWRRDNRARRGCR
jgi:hypothetical protein